MFNLIKISYHANSEYQVVYVFWYQVYQARQENAYVWRGLAEPFRVLWSSLTNLISFTWYSIYHEILSKFKPSKSDVETWN